MSLDYLIVVVLLCLSGMFSGLTIGLSSLSVDDLDVKSKTGCKKAKKVLELVSDYNLMLVTLLFGNTAVNAILTNFMGNIVGSGFITVAISTFLILILGEITPAAVLTKYALKVGYVTAPLVKILIFLFYPIAKPIAFILTKILGTSLPNIYTNKELSVIIDRHYNAKDSDIDEQDGRIIKGVLTLSGVIAGKSMTKKHKIFSLNYDTIINQEILNQIRENGYTRIPVVKDNRVIGIVNSKNIIGIEVDKNIKAINIMRADKFLIFSSTDNLDDILESMVSNKTHIAIIFNKDLWVGIITMEDILEVMFQKEIYDETDTEEDIICGS